MITPVDSFELYLREIKKYPVLTEQEEKEYALDYYNNNNLVAAQVLVQSNLRFVVKVAYEYKSYGISLIDLIQEGNIGLMIAVKKFDPYKEIRLLSYAKNWIHCYIREFIMKSKSLIKIGTTQLQRKLFYNTDKHVDIPEQEREQMQMRIDGELSLNDPINSEYNTEETFQDILRDPLPLIEDKLISSEEQKELRDKVNSVIMSLTEREQYFIQHRIINRDKTLRDLSAEFNISVERARQVEQNIIKKLKDKLPHGKS